MIWHKVPQNTPEWLRMRLGKPTASEFHRIVTPGGKVSKQAEPYMHRLLSELMLGHPILDDFEGAYMQRGHESEPEAIERFEFMEEVETVPGGFFTTDDGGIGASPDRVVEGKYLLEIKSPAAQTQIRYLLEQGVDHEYKCQLQGQLWVSEYDESRIFAHHSKMPECLLRVPRDEEFIKVLEACVTKFSEVLQENRQLLATKYGPFPSLEPKPVERPQDFITDEDLEMILAENERRNSCEAGRTQPLSGSF